MLRRVDLAPDEYYHIYNRGVEKRKLFLDRKDYIRFIKLLYLCNGSRPFTIRELPPGSPYDWERGERLVDIGAYCLMPNHFHLLLYEHTEGGITKFLHKLQTSYAMYFNKKYKRKGVLFESVFQSAHVDSDEYLQYLFAYIHLNPIKIIQNDWKENGIKDLEGAKQYLSGYPFSSYFDHAGQTRTEAKILSLQDFPDYFTTSQEFTDFISYWLDYADDFTLTGPIQIPEQELEEI